MLVPAFVLCILSNGYAIYGGGKTARCFR